jgi:hypothetical protein
MMRWCMRHEIPRFHSIYRVTNTIARAGNMSLIDEYLSTYGERELYSVFKAAAMGGAATTALTLMSRLNLHGVDQVGLTDVMMSLSSGGIVEGAQRLPSFLQASQDATVMPALCQGRFRFIQWVVSETALAPRFRSVGVVWATRSGSLDLVRWLVEEQGCVINEDAVPAAAGAGAIDILEWLLARRDHDLQPLMDEAVFKDQLHVVEWLTEHGCVPTEETLLQAAQYCSVATVAWLLDNGCPYVEETLVEASCRNNKTGDVLTFLFEEKRMRCVPSDCMSAGARAGNFDEALFHRAFGSALTETHLVSCTRWGDVDRVRYALAHGAPIPPSTITFMLNRNECAILKETLEHLLGGETPTAESLNVLLEGMRGVSSASKATVDMVMEFCARLPAKRKA